jgi:hypothetical protein
MKLNIFNEPICPSKGPVRPNKIGAMIVVATIAVAFIFLFQSLAKEPGKDEQMKPKATVITPKDDPKGVEVKPVQASPVQIQPASPPQVQPAPAAPATGEQIKRCVISSGGTTGASANYKLVGIAQQTAVSTGSSASYSLSSGFWQGLVPGFIHGDVNGDGLINLGDVVYLISYQYKGGPPPKPLLAGDVNCDGLVNLGDVVYLITFQYKNGPAPPC